MSFRSWIIGKTPVEEIMASCETSFPLFNDFQILKKFEASNFIEELIIAGSNTIK